MYTQYFNPSPYVNANTWSRFHHSWMFELMKKCKKKTIDIDDLYNLPESLEPTQLTDRLEKNWFDEIKNHPKDPSLFRTTFKTIGWKLFFVGFLFVAREFLQLIQPLLLIYLMKFFEIYSEISNGTALVLAFLIALVAFLGSMFYHRCAYFSFLYGLEMRVAYMGLIFRKILRLSTVSKMNVSSGEIVNLLSNDAMKVEKFISFVNLLWIVPLDIIFVIIVFWYFYKFISIIPIGYGFLVIVCQFCLSIFNVKRRAQILQMTDERIKLMSQIVKSMRCIKMYCWEKLFINKILFLRNCELIRLLYYRLIYSFQFILSDTYVIVAFFLMYFFMRLFNIRFDTHHFAIASCLLRFLQNTAVELLLVSINSLTSYFVAKERIEKFLLLDEHKGEDKLPSGIIDQSTNLPNIFCDIKRAEWKQNKSFALKNIQFEGVPGDLIFLIGSVGSGKTSLLRTLSGEISSLDGIVKIRGSSCYVSQEPWILPITIKENILYGKKYEDERFRRVIDATGLDQDLNRLSSRENTVVGDNGAILSGGQKARINLCRALYRDADIYFLDDPLSAVDANICKHIFERVIREYLREKICIFATHQTQFLQYSTKIINLSKREEQEQLMLNDQMNDFSSLVETRCHENFVEDKENESNPLLMEVDDKEMRHKGVVHWHVYREYFRAGAGIILGGSIIICIFSVQTFVAISSNWWLGKISMTNYTTTNKIRWTYQQNERFYVYSVFVILVVLCTAVRTIVFDFICLNAGRVLHQKMFHRLMNAPISFFDLNPTGRIFNRFSKDIELIDVSLPIAFNDFLTGCFYLLGTLAFVSWLNVWSFIPAIMTTIALISIRNCYSQSLRDLTRLSAVTRSPIYSHTSSTIDGLQVIRSYNAEQLCLKNFYFHLDMNTRCEYLLLLVNRWAGIRMDWILSAFFVIVTILAIILRITGKMSSIVDIALIFSYSIDLIGRVQWTVRQSVSVETEMTSVERIYEYSKLDQEPINNVHPPRNWPQRGQIIFDHVFMSHNDSGGAPLVLKDITLTISAGERLGIVGRTGAGKSSFIQTLFSMAKISKGNIKIDEIDIESIALNDLRSQISVIPQDPILITGSLRENLDPFGFYSDAELWRVLEQVQMRNVILKQMPNELQSTINESGANLSVGQKQLICLARTLLNRKTKIIVIDEATANVDNETDELIQQTIRHLFKKSTVLTIAHRLRTVMDCDRILVLDNGEIVELDKPNVLLNNPNSYLSGLIRRTGVTEEKYLRQLTNLACFEKEEESENKK